MGSGWFIKTFDRARWDAIFGSGTRAAEQKVLDALLWEIDGYFDPNSVELRPGPEREGILESDAGQSAFALARHLAHFGFTYDGLDPPQALLLDEFASTMGAEEALGHELDVEWHSPDFFSMRCASVLLDRTGNSRSWSARITLFGLLGRPPPRLAVRYLPLLLTGWRYGTEGQPTRSEHSFYVVLSPAEVVALRREVVAAVRAPVPWREKWLLSEAEDYLLAPLTKVIDTGRWVLMTCNY